MLYGPLHGGANEAVPGMLERIGSVGDNVSFLRALASIKALLAMMLFTVCKPPGNETPHHRTGAVGALYGPLHGGANEAVLRMLERIGRVDNIGPFLEGVKNRKEKMFGFGHRCTASILVMAVPMPFAGFGWSWVHA